MNNLSLGGQSQHTQPSASSGTWHMKLLRRKQSTRQWKPRSLGAPVLLSFVLISVCLIILLEHLSRVKNREGFVTFADIDDGFSILQSFSLLYLPTILAVVYSMLWTWVDLDVKRLEPYYQLSQIGGASAERSLLIHYPVDFLAFIPIKAARYRHWAVFLAGSITILVGWGITPLQSGIFTVAHIARTTAMHVHSVSSLAPLSSQMDDLQIEFMYKTYGVLWLDEGMPAFTTRDAGLVPFTLEDKPSTNAKAKWTSQSTAYSTELRCTLARVSPQTTGFIRFTDASGCFVNFELPQGPGFILQYAGYQYDPVTDVSILEDGNTDICTRRWQHTFLAISGVLGHNNTANDITGQFCETHYYVQDVMATVWSSNLSVLDYQPIGSRTLLGPDQFNSTNFEYILNTGKSPSSTEKDITQNAVEFQYQIRNDELAPPFNPMVAFALAATNYTVDQFKDPSIMPRAFEAAHKLIFALAVNQLMQPLLRNSKDLSGTVESEVLAIIIVRPFALVVEVLLAIVALATISLYIYNFRRVINLESDPSTIADIMTLRSLLGPSLETLQDISKCNIQAMEAALAKTQYQLLESSRTNPQLHEVRDKHGRRAGNSYSTGQTEACTDLKRSNSTHITNSESLLPLEMSWPLGLTFMIILFLSCLLLVTVRSQITRSGGLQVPYESVIAQQIVLNYIPTAFATFLEPWWVLLSRSLCILQPFEELRRRDSASSRSIGLSYTSLPPQLNIWRAIKARHFTLSLVCVTVLLASPLTVTLSTLFSVSTTSTTQEFLFEVPKLPLFNTSSVFTGQDWYSFMDHFYVEKANITQNTRLPPWISLDYYFLPSHPASSISNEALWEVPTKGFGIASQCQTLEENVAESILHFDINDGKTFFNTSSIETSRDGKKVLCYSQCFKCQESETLPGGAMSFSINAEGARSAMEIYRQMISILPESMVPGAVQCNSQIFVAWVHANFSYSEPLKTNALTDFDVRAMVCRPKFRVADFLVTTSSDGRVLSYTQTSPFDTDLDKYFTSSTNLRDLLATTSAVIGMPNGPTWHNTTVASDWVNYLLTKRMNSTSLVDATAQLPPYAELKHHVQSIHQTLFAILLGLNHQIFTPAPPNSTVSGRLWMPQRRVFMDETMFWISLAILLINLVVAVLYYIFRPKRFLPRMPNSLASVLGFVVASSTIGDGDDDGEEKWRFGKFVGVDGRPHVGIERAALVTPVDVKENKNLRKRHWRVGS